MNKKPVKYRIVPFQSETEYGTYVIEEYFPDSGWMQISPVEEHFFTTESAEKWLEEYTKCQNIRMAYYDNTGKRIK